MGQSLDIPRVIPEDWKRLDLIINKIKMKLGHDADVIHAGLILSDLIASRLIATDSEKTFESIEDLTAWILGTSNQVIVTDNGDGTLTLSCPQDIHTDAAPEFAGITLQDSNDATVVYSDANEFYIVEYTAPGGLVGQPIGLLLVLTYAS